MKSYEKYCRYLLAHYKRIDSTTLVKAIQKYGSAASFIDYIKKEKPEYIQLKEGANPLPFKELDLSSFVAFGENSYPLLLKHIPDPPVILFFKGNIELLNNSRLISIVGTRKCTRYGYKITSKLSKELCQNGYTVVSGMAFGIDSCAHESALEVGGNTVAILGTNISSPYPRSSYKLYKRIVKVGLVVSENFSKIYHKGTFPRRNRIIAGVSKATVVIQAPKRSGSLITAHLAFDYNREVYAVPGQVGDTYCEGSNQLIATSKAKLLTGIECLIKDIQPQLNRRTIRKIKYSETEKKIIDILSMQRTSANDLIQQLKHSPSKILSTLTAMEINNLVEKESGGIYTLLI